MTQYQIIQGDPNGFVPRGGAKQLWLCQENEAMLAGPAETGKTYSALQKLNTLCWHFPRSQAAIVRKTRASMDGTVLDTWRAIIGKNSPIDPYGGEKPEWYDYPNGSRIHVGGMDNPDRILSGERDFVYVNQAEELTLAEWETLITRTTGRAGNAPYPQLFGDCNPGPPTHWIKQRQTLSLFESRHEDNPTLFDDDGKITKQGERSLKILDSLTGLRHKRLRKGLWVSAEGMVYEQYDPAIHLINVMPDGWQSWRKMRSIDFGFTNPFVCLWIAIDPDGRMYVYRQLYMTQRTVGVHAAQINRLSEGEFYEITVRDHDANGGATLQERGIWAVPADKKIADGIQAVQDRLKPAGDDKPRLYVLRNSLVELDTTLKPAPTCIEDEFESYAWAVAANGKPNKEVPVDLHNHAMDALRYAVMQVDHGGTPGV